VLEELAAGEGEHADADEEVGEDDCEEEDEEDEEGVEGGCWDSAGGC